MRRTIWSIAIVLFGPLLVFAAGCSIAKEYRGADQATFDAIAPEYRSYIEADPKLDPDQKKRRLRTLETWKLRLDGGSSP